MEEKKPLESRSLTHTSKEPEAQMWAQIGTSAYDPQVPEAKPADAAGNTSTGEQVENGGCNKNVSESVNPNPTPTAQNVDKSAYRIPKLSEKDDNKQTSDNEDDGDAGSDAELLVDENAVPSQSENGDMDQDQSEVVKNQAEGDGEIKEDKEKEKSKEEGENESKPVLGDGYEDTDDKKSKKKDQKRSRSRSRSRERGSKRSRSKERRDRHSKDSESYFDRTNSTDPKQIRSRLFVGHLNTRECTKEDVEKLFAPFGKITGINLQSGYGFIQYGEEESVKDAIRSMHGTVYCGTRLDEDSRPRTRERERDRETKHRDELMDELEYYRRREMYDRYSRMNELDQLYNFDRAAPPLGPEYGGVRRGDPYAGGYGSSLDRLRLERERYRDRMPGGAGMSLYDRPYDGPLGGSDYDRRPPPGYDPYGSRRL